jgi:predicted transcriptional regulator
MGVAMGTVQYHLNTLEKTDKIVSERYNQQRVYFKSGLFKKGQKNVLKILGQDTSRLILMQILERKNPTQTDLVKNIRISAPSINWHVKRLIELDLILEAREGKFCRYQLAIDPKEVITLLKSFHPSLWNRWSDRLAEMFLSLSRDIDDSVTAG